MYQLAIFDLDGTLLDTLADLRQGLNYALATQGFAPRTLPEVRAFVGNGIRKLIERAVPAGTGEAQIDAVFEAFHPYYAVHCVDFTKPYPGILDLLRKLQADGVVSAVVSNKPGTSGHECRREGRRTQKALPGFRLCGCSAAGG